MKIAVLFDGGGLARLGLELAGHICTGFELDPNKHYLSTMVGSGNCVLADATAVDLSGYSAVWASPPCQWLSGARVAGDPISQYATDYLAWSLSLPHSILWVENVKQSSMLKLNYWGRLYNAAQFIDPPRQNRNRVIGGRHRVPSLIRPYRRKYPNIPPCVTATEYKGGAAGKARASIFFGRRLTTDECAYLQGFRIPARWLVPPKDWFDTDIKWEHQIYEAIGNGVPVYMAQRFGEEYGSTKNT